MADDTSGPGEAGRGHRERGAERGARRLRTPRSGVTASWAPPWAPTRRRPAATAETAHRDLRDRVTALLVDREAEPVGAEGAYALPFPVLSAVDAAALAVVLEDGVAAAWVRVLDQAVERLHPRARGRRRSATRRSAPSAGGPPPGRPP